MKAHVLHDSIAAMVAAIVSAVAITLCAATSLAQTSNHTWPGLTADQKTALAAKLKAVSPAIKLDIVCADGACTDLAQDIDDAAEQAGIDSVLDHPILPLGYGIGVKADPGDDRGQRVADALAAVTGAHLSPIIGTDREYGYVAIFIGKWKE